MAISPAEDMIVCAAKALLPSMRNPSKITRNSMINDRNSAIEPLISFVNFFSYPFPLQNFYF